MKNLLTLNTIVMVLTVSLFSNELNWVNEQVEAIKPSRKGMNKYDLARIRDPFIFLKKNDEESAPKKETLKGTTSSQKKYVRKRSTTNVIQNKMYTLSMIMNNSILINKKWYKAGDKINGYSITLLDTRSVVLKKKKKKPIFLTTKSVREKKISK